jgi:hypothetical protein
MAISNVHYSCFGFLHHATSVLLIVPVIAVLKLSSELCFIQRPLLMGLKYPVILNGSAGPFMLKFLYLFTISEN